MKKKILGFLAVFLACFGVLLTNVEAKGKVTIYLFSQTTCPHCREAKAFFKELKKDSKYKDMFELRDLTVDVKGHEEYQVLFEKAAAKMGDEADGVPYYVIGNKSFTKGYSSKYNDEIKAAIEEAYNLDNFVSPIADIVGDNGEILYENVGNNILAPIIVLVIALAIIGGTIYFARQSGEEEKKDEKKNATKEEKKETIVKDEEQEIPKEEKVEEEEKESEPKEIETVKVEKKSTPTKKTTTKSTSNKTTKKTTTAKKSTTTKKAPAKKTTTTKTATTKKRNTTKK